MAQEKIKVAIASDFLSAFSAIPKQQQKKVLEFVNKFKSDPTSSGINYEKISSFKDQSLRSVRIDQAYRGIVKKPDSGNIFMLLWVDHHDEAYRWAENKKCEINPETGSLQIYEVVSALQDSTDSSDIRITPGMSPLFLDFRDRELLKLGVPECLLPNVREITLDEQLDRLASQLPQEAYEGLFFLAAGYTLEEVFRELETTKEEQDVDTTDFQKALENPESKRRFFIVEDDIALQEMLNAPLEKWRVFLHPSQRSMIEKDRNGPVRILGGAGTGKTVAAIHRAKWLAEKRFNSEGDKILFTTFTRNLAGDIRENLSKICSDNNVLRRIEVVNLDKWVSEFLKKNEYSSIIAYGRKVSDLWAKALSLAPAEQALDNSFYREEWERVIQPQGISNLSEYLKATRLGRGMRLNRKNRKDIWEVFEEYRLLLNEYQLKEPEDAMRDARSILKEKGDILPYKAIIIDEAQDMGMQAFRLIRQMIPLEGKNDLFIVGDAHQRIYRHKVTLSHCGINIIGRSKKLKINYRTTEQNRQWAINLLHGIKFDDLDGGEDNQKGYKSLLKGKRPSINCFETSEQEVDFLIQYLENHQKGGNALKEICLVARTKNLVEQYEEMLTAKGQKIYRVRTKEGDDRGTEGLRLATMHRVKGLEFEKIIIAAVNDKIVPLEGDWAKSADPVVLRELEIRERALLYVAATRAKKEVVVTAFGKPSRFLGEK